MNISLNWLQDFIKLTTNDLDLIQERITNRSAEIEEVIKEGEVFKNVVIGEILKIEKHPDADKLNVTQTRVGEETFQIVCGAKNIEEGQKVPVALVGAVLPGDFKIQKAKIRGIESCGMICAETELGLAEESEGIWVLPQDAQVGMLMAEYLGMNDVTFDVSNTAITNRADLFSHIGFANEFVANDLAEHKVQVRKDLPLSSAKFPVEIEITEDELCPHYAAVIVKNIKIEESPEWMQKRLRAVGIRPINNIVDVTNYVMMELGMPLHAFDLSKIKGDKIVMRRSQKGEKVVTLDNIERKLPEDVILLEDSEKVFDLCGIMGGANSEISDDTTEILLHAPIYHPTLIRKAMLYLAHRTEAATMYEKGVPGMRAQQGIERALELILDLLPKMKIESEIYEFHATKIEERIIDLPKAEITRVMNQELKDELVIKILTDLGFEVTNTPNEFQVNVPQYRYGDITAKHELVEEVVRIYDVNKLPEVLPEAPLKPAAINKSRRLERKIKDTFAAIGFNEILTYSFIGPDLMQKMGITKTEEVIEIENPITQDVSLMQTTLLPSLMEILAQNIRYQNSCNLFEFATVYFQKSITEVLEEKHFAGVMFETDFYELKGKLDFVFQDLGFNARYMHPQSLEKMMHPSRTADLFVGKDRVGFLTEIHPQFLKNFDLKKSVVAFEFNFTTLLETKTRQKVYKALPKFPSVNLDLSILIERKIEAEKLLKTIQKTDNLITEVSVIDVYEGERLPEGKKSLTFSIKYQATDRTLQDEEVQKVHKQVLINVQKLGGELR